YLTKQREQYTAAQVPSRSAYCPSWQRTDRPPTYVRRSGTATPHESLVPLRRASDPGHPEYTRSAPPVGCMVATSRRDASGGAHNERQLVRQISYGNAVRPSALARTPPGGKQAGSGTLA